MPKTILSIAAGFIAWSIVWLITVGVFVQGMNLALMPLWYHIIFVALLLPAAAAGGRLRKIQETGK